MDEHVLKTYRRTEQVFVGGKGATLFDSDGRAYLDLLSGIGVTALGHAHPALVAAVTEQLGRVTHVSNLLRHEHTEELAGRLASLTGLDSAFFVNSGSEAIETALKIARKVQKSRGNEDRTGFVALEGGFHGRTFGAISLASNAAYREPFAPVLEARFVAANAVDALAGALAPPSASTAFAAFAAPAALVIEPLQGEGGLTLCSTEFLQAARQLCDETGTILIHDEVQCGAGRTGTFLCAERAGVVPDIATLAKPIAGGLPMGVTLVREELADVLVPGDHGSTFGGGPLASRAALVFLDELEGGLQDNVVERGAELAAGLDAIVAEHAGVTERRGLGLLQGIVVPKRSADVQKALLAAGLVCATAGGEVVRFLPPYVITAEEIGRALELLDETLTETLEG